jgi:hypothetical protein
MGGSQFLCAPKKSTHNFSRRTESINCRLNQLELLTGPESSADNASNNTPRLPRRDERTLHRADKTNSQGEVSKARIPKVQGTWDMGHGTWESPTATAALQRGHEPRQGLPFFSSNALVTHWLRRLLLRSRCSGGGGFLE